MQTPLNRIEFQYVFDEFKKELPALKIISAKDIFYLNNEQYEIKGMQVFFDKICIENKDKLKIVFFHKKRPLYFFSQAEEHNSGFYFQFSEKIYKYDSEQENKFPFLYFKTDSGLVVKADVCREFPLKLDYKNVPHTALNSRLNDFALLQNKTIQTIAVKNKIPDDLINRIYQIEVKKIVPETIPCLIFLDSQFVLLFYSKNAKSNLVFNSLFNLNAEAVFINRKVNFLLDYLFSYGFENCKGSFQNALNEVICFKIKNIQEEDKRFLYENAYSVKYGCKNESKKYQFRYILS